MAKQDVLLFPSIHDEGGFVVAEALAAGLPVVCLHRGGPPEIGGTGVIPTDVSRTVADLAQTVRDAAHAPIHAHPDIDSSAARIRKLLETRLPHLFEVHEERVSSKTFQAGPEAPASTIDGIVG